MQHNTANYNWSQVFPLALRYADHAQVCEQHLDMFQANKKFNDIETQASQDGVDLLEKPPYMFNQA
jgi:hypothetical protein